MNTLKSLIIAGSIGLYATNASAFEQVQMGGATPSDNQTTGQKNNIPRSVPGVELVTPPTSTKPETGTKLRLPGFGVIGTLPKLDFGLELLYGEDRSAGVEEDRGQTTEGLTIHGSLKHRF